MGPKFIVVVVRFDGGCAVEEFTDEDAAREAYKLRQLDADVNRCYLATVRSEARF